MKTLTIKKAGVLTIRPNGDVHADGFSFGAPGGSATRVEIVAALRQWALRCFDNEPGLPALVDTDAPTPIGVQAEREAEMETYTLINRCQGEL